MEHKKTNVGENMKTKQGITLCLSIQVVETLRQYCAEKNVKPSVVMENALADFFAKEAAIDKPLENATL